MKAVYLRKFITKFSLVIISFVFVACIIRPTSVHADSGLVAHWAFDDGTGNTASDLSGSSNDMSIIGTASWVDGKVGSGALSFDGSTNYAHLSTFSNTPSTAMTLCSWIKTSSSAEQDILGFSRNGGGNNNEGIFRILPTGKVQFWDYGNSYGFPFDGAGSDKTVADNHWHLVCFVKDGTSGTYYVDGIRNGTVTAASDVVYGSHDWVIGKDYRDNSSYFNGFLDDVRVYNRALSSSEVADLYGLIGYWKFDDGSGSTAIDSSSNGNNGTLFNNPSWVPGKLGGALQFNGGSSYVEIQDAPVFEATSSLTVSAWVYSPNFQQNAMIVTKNPVNTDWQLFLETGSSGEGSGGIKWRSGSGVSGIVAPFPSDGEWHQVTAVQSATLATLYIDGVSEATGTVADLGTEPGTLDIGRFDNDFYFNGNIDDVRIYGRALSADEVLSFLEFTPSQVSNLQASGSYKDGFSLTWDPNPEQENIDDYIIEYSTDSGSSWTTIDTASTTTNYNLTNVIPGDYLFRVSAQNVVGQGDASNQVEVNSQPTVYNLGSSCADLENIANTPGDPYGHYVMTQDINCADVPNFSPIDFSDNGFEGIFDGGGHTILNLAMDVSDTTEYGGLFLNSYGATFENLNFDNGSIAGVYELGTLVGFAQNTLINSVTSNSNVSGTADWSWALGGLVGEAYYSTISHSSSSGDVSGGDYASGGLAGYVYDLTIDHSFTTGNIVGYESVGGLVGDAYDDGGLDASYCFATGDVTGGDGIGGLVGQLGTGNNIGAHISNCYSTSTISENTNIVDDYYDFGGLVGYTNNALIEKSYYAGSITGNDYLGGLVGEFSNSSIRDSFSAPVINLDDSPVGSIVGSDDGYNGFDENPPFSNVVYDASSYGACDGMYDGVPEGCTPVNTEISPDTNYFFNNTTHAPFSNDGQVWDFSSVWLEHSATYPTLIGLSLDLSGPAISAITSSTTQTSASISWITDQTSSSQIVYSTDESYSSDTNIENTSPLVSNHNIDIENLTACTAYHFEVVSTNASSVTSTSTDQTFTTTCPVPVVVNTASVAHNTGRPFTGVPVQQPALTPVVPAVSGTQASTPVQSSIITPVSIFQFLNDLEYGARGSDVQKLQQFLNTHGSPLASSGPGSAGHETTFFSARTKQALIKFQKAHNSQILSPQGLNKGTGLFYSYSRKFVNTVLRGEQTL